MLCAAGLLVCTGKEQAGHGSSASEGLSGAGRDGVLSAFQTGVGKTPELRRDAEPRAGGA